MASDFSAAKQEFVDRLNANAVLNIPFIQKRVNLGQKALNEDARTQGVIELYVPAGGTGSVETLTNASGIASGALDRSSDTGKMNSSFYKVTCYAKNGWEVFKYNVLEKMFQTGNIKKNIVEGRARHMANNIEKDLVDRNWTKAGGALVSTAADFGVLSKAIAYLEAIKADGSWTGYMSPLLKSLLSTASMREKFDLPDDVLKDMYGRNSIGTYGGADWVNEAFMPTFSVGALNTTDAASGITVKADVSTQGATKITITGFAASGTIKKGTPFTIAGIYDVTTGGVQQTWLKTFIVQADATAAADSTVYKYELEVLPIYFNDDSKGYQNNVYAASSKIPANATVTALCAAGKSYYTCLIREDSAFNWTPFKLDDVQGCENTTSETEDLTIQLCTGGTLLTRTNTARMDCPYFGDIVDPRANRLVLVEV